MDAKEKPAAGFTRFQNENVCGIRSDDRRRRQAFCGCQWQRAKRPFYSGQSIVNYFVGRGCDSISRIFEAASEKDNGRADKFFAVVESFNQWAENTIADFKLSKSNQFHSRYRPIMKSVTPENNLPSNFAANFIIEKGSPRHNAHIKYLKAAAKRGDKAAIANLKQHGIEVEKTAEKSRR